MNSGTIFIIGLVSFFVLIFWVIPKFYRRKIELVFMKPNSPIIYVLTNAKSSTMSKRGIYDNHRIYFNKANIETGEIIYRIKIKNFTTKMLNGYARIVGINDSHCFITMSGERLYVVNINTGKIELTHKSLVKLNPSLKAFQTSEIKYDYIKEVPVLFDKSGYGYYLNAQTKSLEKLNSKSENFEIPKENVGFFQLIDDYKLAKLTMPEWHPRFHEDWRFNQSNEKTIYTKDTATGKRKFMVFGNPREDSDTVKYENDFLHPQLIKSGIERKDFIADNQFLILHFEKESTQANDMLISCVGVFSKIIWTLRLKELFPNIYASKNSLVFFEKINGKIFLFSYQEHTESNKLFVSQLDIKTGKNSNKPLIIKF